MVRRPPRPLFPRAVAALFGLLLAAGVITLVVPFVPRDQALSEGERAPLTLEAAHGAQYESEALTEAARNEAAASVVAVQRPLDPSVSSVQVDRLRRVFERTRTVRQRSDLPTNELKLAELNSVLAAERISGADTLSPGTRSTLLALDAVLFDQVQQKALAALAEILDAPVAEGGERDAVLTHLARSPGRPANELAALNGLLSFFVVPNVAVDREATERKREDERANVAPVIVTYTRGQVVVREGDELQPEDVEALRRTGVLEGGFRIEDFGAGATMSLAFGLVVALFAYQLQPFERPVVRRALVVSLAVVGVLAAVRFVLPEVMPDREQHYLAFAIPVATAAMVAASFAALPFAVVVALAVGLFAAFIGVTEPDLAGANFVGTVEAHELGLAYVAGGLAGAAIVHRAERLSRYAFSAIAVASATWVVLFAFWLLGETQTRDSLGWLSLAAGLNGLGSAVISAGIFVVLSMALGVTTRLQLMELAHGGHPLLRRLQDEAPGTYHHSMMVGALAERAAGRIGADALVARAGAYYHDIGKLAQPGYYIENMLDGAASPHDALPPQISAGIIRDHVTNGLEIARRHRLPPLVRDFIPQHHGTRLVTFFYRLAAQAPGTVDPGPFRYAGPRPESKESAIVMLADSCEAVVRATGEGGRAHIDETIDSVFAERLAEGQLDECDITMRELLEVAASFKATLRAVYHPRIEYPGPLPEELAGIASPRVAQQ
ncbi:MAG: HD family phosphohydrolase [Tepidiformaceae bacterium]